MFTFISQLFLELLVLALLVSKIAQYLSNTIKYYMQFLDRTLLKTFASNANKKESSAGGAFFSVEFLNILPDMTNLIVE